MAEQRFPQTNDIDGNLLAVREAAVAWRARLRTGRGRPQSVFDPATGAQLEIEFDDSTVDTLRPFWQDGYRLDAIHEEGRILTRPGSSGVKGGSA